MAFQLRMLPSVSTSTMASGEAPTSISSRWDVSCKESMALRRSTATANAWATPCRKVTSPSLNARAPVVATDSTPNGPSRAGIATLRPLFTAVLWTTEGTVNRGSFL